ncbi:hypothetical protein Z043_105783, partial [Scleropages formosus]
NKSSFLCGVIKTYREREKHGSKEQESAKGPHESKIMVSASLDPDVIKCHTSPQALLERTRYTLDVTTGQRKYGGPPSEAIPRDLYEEELVPVFEMAGPIRDLCLMMDSLSRAEPGICLHH